jgi:hypothetical protein
LNFQSETKIMKTGCGVIPALRKLRQEDYGFEARLGYLTGSGTVLVMRPCLQEEGRKGGGGRGEKKNKP